MEVAGANRRWRWPFRCRGSRRESAAAQHFMSGCFVKKPLLHEIIAALLAIFGAFLLVGVYMPVINPGQTRIETHQELPSVGYYIIMTPIPLAVLLASWYFNRKAQLLKRGEKRPEEKHRKLKWILFGIVVLLILYAFLW
jgi:uncharacterized membrane protein